MRCGRLRQLWRQDPARRVLVAGEAGIGKSRLLREFAERLASEGWIVVQGNCFERDRPLHYGPFLDELHFYALGGVQSRLATRQPLLLVIEDLHWADDTSLELLAVFARRVRREPILVLGSYRDDEVSAGLSYLLDELDRNRLAVGLRLTRLSREQVAAMLRVIFEMDRQVHPGFPSGEQCPD